MKEIQDMSKKELRELLVDAAKNWLAHDGLWFRAAEEKFGIETAMELDKAAWEHFTVIEAKRIMKRLNIQPGGGIPALIHALKFRLYAHINIQEVIDVQDNSFVFRMNRCRVQDARKRQGLPDFPCKSVGIIEYSGFARTIDPRIQTKCIIHEYCSKEKIPLVMEIPWDRKIAEAYSKGVTLVSIDPSYKTKFLALFNSLKS